MFMGKIMNDQARIITCIHNVTKQYNYTLINSKIDKLIWKVDALAH